APNHRTERAGLARERRALSRLRDHDVVGHAVAVATEPVCVVARDDGQSPDRGVHSPDGLVRREVVLVDNAGAHDLEDARLPLPADELDAVAYPHARELGESVWTPLGDDVPGDDGRPHLARLHPVIAGEPHDRARGWVDLAVAQTLGVEPVLQPDPGDPQGR